MQFNDLCHLRSGPHCRALQSCLKDGREEDGTKHWCDTQMGGIKSGDKRDQEKFQNTLKFIFIKSFDHSLREWQRLCLRVYDQRHHRVWIILIYYYWYYFSLFLIHQNWVWMNNHETCHYSLKYDNFPSLHVREPLQCFIIQSIFLVYIENSCITYNPDQVFPAALMLLS